METHGGSSSSNPPTFTGLQTLVVPIPPEDVGRLIGKQGVQVRVLREQAGCDISVNTADRAHPVARLKGTPETLAVAKALIASICGGEGITFLRDLDDFTIMCLTRQQWLKQEQVKHAVTTEFKGRHLKITSLNGTTSSAQNFKHVIETYLKHQTERITERVPCLCDSASVLKRLREHPDVQALEARCSQQPFSIDVDTTGGIRLRGPRMAVNEIYPIVESVARGVAPTYDVGQHCTQSLTLPVISRLCDGASAKKMDDFYADLQEGIMNKFHVTVHYSPGASECVIEGVNIQDVVSALSEMEHLLCYYFNTFCAIIPIERDAVNQVCQVFESQETVNDSYPNRLLAPLFQQRPDDVCCKVYTTTDEPAIWLCGKPALMDSATQCVLAFLQGLRSSDPSLPCKKPTSGQLSGSGRQIMETSARVLGATDL